MSPIFTKYGAVSYTGRPKLAK